MRFLAVDPGAHSAGWAVFTDEALTGVHWTESMRVSALLYEMFTFPVDGLAVEVPQIYVARMGAPPSDLVDVALTAGQVIGAAVIKQHDVRIQTVLPSAWKGQVPKELVHQRLREKLSPEELAVLAVDLKSIAASRRHNALDAVGLGLWALNRMGRGGA